MRSAGRYKKHIFFCENIRGPEADKPSCGKHNTVALRDKMREILLEKGLSKIYRTNSAGCLGACKFGPTVVIYPDAIWYGGVQESDIEEIVELSVLGNEVIERLLIQNPPLNNIENK